MARTSVYRLRPGNPVANHCSMLEKSQLIMWEVTSVRQYWSAPAAIRVMANETNNATVTGVDLPSPQVASCSMAQFSSIMNIAHRKHRHALHCKHDTAGLRACTDVRQ